jgi:hypothetical protein
MISHILDSFLYSTWLFDEDVEDTVVGYVLQHKVLPNAGRAPPLENEAPAVPLPHANVGRSTIGGVVAALEDHQLIGPVAIHISYGHFDNGVGDG